MKILLVQHKGSLSKADPYTRSSSLESLALGYLASAVEASGHIVMVDGSIDEKGFRDLLVEFKPDVVGFSVYSYALQDSLDLARIYKTEVRNGDKIPVTIFGGYHPTARPEETVCEQWVDFVVLGEGEETLCELLGAIEINKGFEDVAGIAFQQGHKVIRTVDRERIASLDTLPHPKRDRAVLARCRQYQISYPPASKQKSVAQVLYSRGCPFSCSYCAAENIWKKRIIWRDPECVCDELEELIQDYGTNLIYFPDLTLNANKRRLLDFCQVLSARNLPLHWWGFFRLDLLDAEMLNALVDAKCIKLGIGVESPVQSCASQIKDSLSIKEETKKSILKHANEVGMLLRAFLMIGLPDDTEERILAYPQQMLEDGYDEIRACFATPFPGTRFFEEAKQSGLLPEKIDWNAMTTESPYLKHPTLSKQQLFKLQKEIILQFYMSRAYAEHVVDKTTRFPIMTQSWVENLEFLNSNGVFRGRETDYVNLMKALEKSNSEQNS